MTPVRKSDLRMDELSKLPQGEQMERLVSAHNALSSDAERATAGLLSHQLIRLPVKTGSNVDDSFPVTMKLGSHMPDVPLSVTLARIVNLTDTDPSWTGAVQVFWELAGPRQFLVRYITGLDTSKQYDIHLLVLA
jgi:hypothetical protein